MDKKMKGKEKNSFFLVLQEKRKSGINLYCLSDRKGV